MTAVIFSLEVYWGKKKRKKKLKTTGLMNVVCFESNHVKRRSCNLIYAEYGIYSILRKGNVPLRKRYKKS